uniref:Uncharacterized protein n=1 Tax=Romanomermis culicivorax TaxID=13658 RepID=A0A915I3B5_ROMCU
MMKISSSTSIVNVMAPLLLRNEALSGSKFAEECLQLRENRKNQEVRPLPQLVGPSDPPLNWSDLLRIFELMRTDDEHAPFAFQTTLVYMQQFLPERQSKDVITRSAVPNKKRSIQWMSIQHIFGFLTIDVTGEPWLTYMSLNFYRRIFIGTRGTSASDAQRCYQSRIFELGG